MQIDHLIENIAFKLPELPPPPRKNFFDILGIQNKEVLNSRVLAYFFNPEEEHGLGTLFFDSLCELLSESGKDFPALETSFEVLLEESTSNAVEEENRRKSIDLVLDADDWAIIIENKLYHHLNNPLDVYVEHKRDKEDLVGVILSIQPINNGVVTTASGFNYVNITHFQLIEKVQALLKLGNELSSTTLFYLNEYIKTIQSHEQSKIEKPIMNEVVSSLINQSENIKSIQQKIKEAENYISEVIDEYFFEKGYDKRKDLFYHQNLPGLYFWIHPSRDILKDNYLRIHFEAQDKVKDKITSNQVITFFRNNETGKPYVEFGHEGRAPWCIHFARYNNRSFLKPNESFSEAFEMEMDKVFFSENGIVPESVRFLEKTINYQGLIPGNTIKG